MLLNNKSFLDYLQRRPMTVADLKTFLNSNLKMTNGDATSYTDTSTSYTMLGLTYCRDLSEVILSQTEAITLANDDTENCCGSIDLVIGSGTTAPTYSDYALENQITSVKHIAQSLTYGTDGTKLIRTFQNISNSAITVSEVGALTRIHSKLIVNAAVSTYQILIARNVLTTPLTVQPNEYFTVMITL